MCRLPMPLISTFDVLHGPAMLLAVATYMFAPGPSPEGSVCVMSARLMYGLRLLEFTRGPEPEQAAYQPSLPGKADIVC